MKRFILKPEVVSHGNQPVYQDLAHALSDLNLLCHVVDFLEVVFLLPSAPVVDVVGVLGAIEDNFHGLSVLPQAVWVHISNVERPRFILRTKNLLNPAKMVKFEKELTGFAGHASPSSCASAIVGPSSTCCAS